MNPRILIVEDDLDIQQFLVTSLEDHGFQTIACSDGEAALQLFETNTIELILLDVQLPKLSGFDVCKKVRASSNVPIIFISCLLDGSDIIHGLELGGDDYVTKPFDLYQLIARIKSNLRRAPIFHQVLSTTTEKSPSVFDIKNMKINVHLQQVTVGPEIIPLSQKEFRTLSILAQNPNKTFNAHELYTLIWGEDSLGETRTLKVHICNLRKKIELYTGESNIIRTVRGFGYQLVVNT